MTPPPDPASLALEAGPSLLGAALRAGAAVALLAAAAWIWLRLRRRPGAAGRALEVVDRLVLGRSASVVLLRVEGERILLGVSADGVRCLRGAGPRRGRADFPRALVQRCLTSWEIGRRELPGWRSASTRRQGAHAPRGFRKAVRAEAVAARNEP